MSAFVLALDPHSHALPLFLQIARALSADIRRGRLAPGARLPGSRSLAASLGVHRNTVLAAYRELLAEGWLETDPARATRVRAELPDERPIGWGRGAAAEPPRDPERVGFALPKPRGATGALGHVRAFSPRGLAQPLQSGAGSGPDGAIPRGTIALYGGLPELGTFPIAELTRAYRRAAVEQRGAALDYGDPAGEPALRAAIAAYLSSTRGVAAEADDVLVTRGSQMALYLAAAALVRPGDAVAVEERGYPPAWGALRAAGAELCPVRVDDGGLCVDALAALARRRSLRAVYATPHHQYPTTRTLAPERRLALLELCAARGVAVLEDDYDHEFHYDGRPILPLASADRAGCVVYFGTFSKVLAPSLRLGFALAPRPVLRRMIERRVLVDRQGDRLLELAVADLFESGEAARHVRRMRRLYEARRAAMAGGLTRRFGARVAFELPRGGMAIWARFDRIDVDAWALACEQRGVLLQTGKRFSFDGRPSPHLRLGFAGWPEARLDTALARMRECLPLASAAPRRRAAAVSRTAEGR